MSRRVVTQTHQQTQELPQSTNCVLQHKCACGQHTVAGSECAACRKKRLQRKATEYTNAETAPPIVHEVLRSPGQPLDAGTRTFMEPRFGHDFSRVRVHTSAKAAESARAVNALAYTVGQDIVFGARQYTLEATSGKKLLAHELTHVVQQGNYHHLSTADISIRAPRDRFELEAETVADYVVSSSTLDTPPVTTNLTKSEPTLHRMPEACPPEREEESEHPGTCPEIERESGELERFSPLVETVAINECYLITGMASGSTEFGVPLELNSVADLLMVDRTITVHLTGYTDCKGGAGLNANLRMNRAAAVEDYFTNVLGISPERVFVETVALTQFIDTNRTSEGRARNRSVAIYLEQGPYVPPREVREIPMGPFLDLQIHCMATRFSLCNLPGGVPTEEDVRRQDENCRRDTSYSGPPVMMADLQCEQPGLAIAESLERSYRGWREVLPPCPCTEPEASRSQAFSRSNSMIGTFHPGASDCFRSPGIRSGPGTSHSQQCCYDGDGALITEGPGAGTPDAWSSSTHFWRHQDIDVTPWEQLGSATYNRFWVPDNRNNCRRNRKP